MKIKDYGINSITDAFVALDDVLDEEISVDKQSKHRRDTARKLREGATVDLNNVDDLNAAENFRKNDVKEEASELEVIDVDANALDQLKDQKSYIGKILLQCNSCKATRFIDIDKLKADENDPELYNVEDECPHCHNVGVGYELLGQVSKKTDNTEEASLDNDANTEETAMFDNTDEVEPEVNDEENSDAENSDNDDSNIDNDEETDYDTTDAEDDTEELNLPKLGDEFDVDDVLEDDTEEKDDKKKTKKESLEEDTDIPNYYPNYLRDADDQEDHDYELDYLRSRDEDGLNNDDEDLAEDLDMATFEGSIANLIDTFTIEDNPVNIKLLNKNGSELGMYGSDDLPFNVKSQMMDTFNTDDNYLEVNVTEDKEEGTTVNDLFNYYRPDEDNQTTFVVTNVDTDEEQDFEDLTEFLETYGDYYIDGALGLRTLNIYIADGDLETEVEPLSDEEVIELGKENAEKEEVTDESLIEEIINCYPGLKLNRINNPLAEEYFIAESIRLNEDIEMVYNHYVKPANDEKLIEHFKSYTGYEDEIDKFLKEHNISKDKYNNILKESTDSDLIYSVSINQINNSNKYRLTKVDKSGETTFLDVNKDKVKSAISNLKTDNPNIKIDDPSKVLDESLNEVNEKLLTSVKDRAELGEAINKLVSANEKYRIAKSLTEGYRYDIFVNEDCKLSEDLFDIKPVDNKEAEPVEGEIIDDISTEVVEPTDSTDVVPEGMRPEDVEIVQKIDRIASDICDAIHDVYGLDVQDKKNLVAADIIQDLQLIGGEKVVDDLENTPINELTKQMYQEFNGFYDAMDELVSLFTGQQITTSQADRPAHAIESLDGEQFTRDTIYKQIASDRFLQAAQAGYIPFVDAAQLEGPVDENLEETVDEVIVDEDGDIEDPNFSLSEVSEKLEEDAKDNDDKKVASFIFNEMKVIYNADEETQDSAKEFVEDLYNDYPDEFEGVDRVDVSHLDYIEIGDRKYTYEGGRLSDLANNMDENLDTSVNNNPEDEVERRLGELNYLKSQRELTDEEQEELANCEKEILNKMDEKDLHSEKINIQEFDECINNYLNENEDEVVAYRSTVVEDLDKELKIKGIIEGIQTSQLIEFNLTENLSEDLNGEKEFTVTNNINDLTFKLQA